MTHLGTSFLYLFVFFNDTATTEIYTLSLHDALPICCGEPLRCEQRLRQPADRIRVDGVDLGHDPVQRQQLGVGDQRLAETIHSRRGRLHREEDAPLEVLLRPRELALREVAAGDIRYLLAGDGQRIDEVVLARAKVDPDLPAVCVLRDERVDGVRHPSLLANFLEETRGRRAAEDRVEQRRRETPAIGTRDPGGAEADVVLLGVLALEAKRRRRRLDQRRADVRARAFDSAATLESACDELNHLF